MILVFTCFLNYLNINLGNFDFYADVIFWRINSIENLDSHPWHLWFTGLFNIVNIIILGPIKSIHFKDIGALRTFLIKWYVHAVEGLLSLSSCDSCWMILNQMKKLLFWNCVISSWGCDGMVETDCITVCGCRVAQFEYSISCSIILYVDKLLEVTRRL